MLPRLRFRTGQKAEDESALRTREQHGTEKQTLKVAAMKFRCSKTNRCSNILHFVLDYVFFYSTSNFHSAFPLIELLVVVGAVDQVLVASRLLRHWWDSDSITCLSSSGCKRGFVTSRTMCCACCAPVPIVPDVHHHVETQATDACILIHSSEWHVCVFINMAASLAADARPVDSSKHKPDSTGFRSRPTTACKCLLSLIRQGHWDALLIHRLLSSATSSKSARLQSLSSSGTAYGIFKKVTTRASWSRRVSTLPRDRAASRPTTTMNRALPPQCCRHRTCTRDRSILSVASFSTSMILPTYWM